MRANTVHVILALFCITAAVEQGVAWKTNKARQRKSIAKSEDDAELPTVNATAFDNILSGLESKITTMIETKLDELLPQILEKHLSELNSTQTDKKGLIGPRGFPGFPGPPGPQGPSGPKGDMAPSISKPTVVDYNLDKITMVVDEATFDCHFAGIPMPTVKWTTNIFNYTQDDYVLGNNEIRSFLTAYVSRISDQGPIKCTATNIAGEAEANGTLTIYTPPTVEKPVSIHTAGLGLNTTLPIMKVNANPAPRITWSRKDGAQSLERFIQNDGVLTIVNVKPEDEGTWIFNATNPIGTYTTEVFLRAVTFGFGQIPPSTYLVKQFPAELKCEVFGDTSVLSAKWVKISGEVFTMTSTEVKTSSSVKILSDATRPGYYMCEVTGGPSALKAYTELKMIKKYDGYSEWSEFSPCTKCDGMEKSHRNRTCETPYSYGTGTTCKVLGEVDVESLLCSETKCHGCVYVSGDGGDGGEESIGDFQNEAECAEKCMKKRKENSDINGATVDEKTGKSCFCEFNMTNRDGSKNYKSCIFPGLHIPTTSYTTFTTPYY